MAIKVALLELVCGVLDTGPPGIEVNRNDRGERCPMRLGLGPSFLSLGGGIESMPELGGREFAFLGLGKLTSFIARELRATKFYSSVLFSKLVLKDPGALAIARAQPEPGKLCVPDDLFHDIPRVPKSRAIWGRAGEDFSGLPQSSPVLLCSYKTRNI